MKKIMPKKKGKYCLLTSCPQSPFFTVVNSRAALAAVLDKAGGAKIKGVAYKIRCHHDGA
jgi:hypothetical protein